MFYIFVIYWGWGEIVKATVENQVIIRREKKQAKRVFLKKEGWISLALLVGLLAIWEAAQSNRCVFHELILPAPSLVAVATVELLSSSFFYLHFGVTMYETIAGFLIGGFLAIILRNRRFIQCYSL